MRIDARLVATCSLLLAAACGGGSSSSGSGSGFQSAIQGTWVSQCAPAGASSSYDLSLVVTGTTVNVTMNTFATSAICQGTSVPTTVASGTITVGASVASTLGSTAVTAYKVDIAENGTTSYDLAYIDAAATPDRLYTGDTSGSNDGSTSALRPTALDESVYFSRP